MKKNSLLIVVAFILGIAATAHAQDRNYAGKSELGIQAGGLLTEGHSAYKDAGAFGGRFGYYVTNNWEVEADVVTGKDDIRHTSKDATFTIPFGELQYHFGDGALRPYLSAGAGGLYFFPEQGSGFGNTRDFIGVLGGGIKWLLTENFAVRADAKELLDTESGTKPGRNYGLITAGLSLLWGGEAAPAPEAKPAKVVEAPKVTDSDNDGVPDDKDQCPGTPVGVKVDEKGCALDSDHDGVSDDKDKCPNTPAGVKVNADGCPLDSDNDGVSDDKDECPGTPAGTKVDLKGCPEGTKEVPQDTWVLEGVTFESGSDKLTEGSKTKLDEATAILAPRTTVRVEVQGHTDNTGKPEMNLSLSQRRAEAVKSYLVSKGITADRLEAKGYGESQPKTDNKTKEGRAKNRRIEFKVLSR